MVTVVDQNNVIVSIQMIAPGSDPDTTEDAFQCLESSRKIFHIHEG